MAVADDIRRNYLWSAAHEFAGSSELYRDWAEDAASDGEVLQRLARLPDKKAQPHLVFAAARFHGAPLRTGFRAWLLDAWETVEPTILTRSTQTNEAARCGTLLPALDGIRGPLALIEVGASAGLCLLPDRYSYLYETPKGSTSILGDPSAPVISTRLTGIEAPTRHPEIVWRAGIDLNPLDVRDPDDVAWLETLVWPEHEERRVRLHAALALAAHDPPRIVRGDLVDALPALAAEAPRDATLVVLHTAVLNYLTVEHRRTAVDVIRSTGARWISQEGIAVLDSVKRRLPAGVGAPPRYVLAVDEEPIALTGFHGGSYEALQPR